jgi:hypothetical protein
MAVALEHLADGSPAGRNFETLARTVNPPLPQARVYNSASQALTTATVTLLTFDSERFDNGTVHSTSANTGRLTVPITGLYLVGAKLNWQVAGTGRREAFISHSAGGEVARDGRDATSTGVSFLSPSGIWQAAAGEYFTVSGYHERGSNLSVDVEFWMVRLGGYTNMGV